MHDLDRFLKAQADSYETALKEIRSGKKGSHWMWYIFPQLKGLGRSEMAAYYGIANGQEADAYLSHPILGRRLQEISMALLALDTSDAETVFGYTDQMKLHSCMTLFYEVSHFLVFKRVLDKFFDGERDPRTVAMLDAESPAKR